ncbi:flagellar biosynthesis protein FlhB [Jannaschia sp. W003]|uniref:EscU/YscU/HrcU family type III secretion system export apparatus switch protein n=1 Tax=Jannaschia sp. W003 TaxID=2867012 RepID=UPI0021A60EFC|nr:flagellar type III secretion system protein FlhB [Jannaschia sp. W003]UWQ21829.1 flagellar type III secretion system protein FlhB [Jannaschia sp. W003]
MSEEADKPHEPTPRKLQKAREKGEIARSAELNAFGLYCGGAAALLVAGPPVARRLVDVGAAMLAGGSAVSMAAAGSTALREAALASAWLAAAPALAVAGAVAAQRAAVMAPSRLAPKAARVSILANAKNKFGPTGLFEFAKSAAKMTLYGALLGAVLWSAADPIIAAAALPAAQGTMLLGRLVLASLAVVVGVAGCIAAVDVTWQRHSHASRNRMSRQELQDEMKESDGDPQFKAQRRQRAQEIAMNQMLADVPDATVVVVNPTHYAVALRWSAAEPSPPVCLAKGTDAIALRIREAAEAARVPIFSDPPTARALHATVELGDAIPREHFRAVAAAIRFAEALRREAGR